MVFSCSNHKEGIDLSTFTLSEIPDSLSGCSCLFSNSKKEFDANTYIYFDDVGDNGLISMKGKILFLNMENETYRNDHYTAYIQNKIQIDEGDESAIYNAELVIVDKQGNKRIYSVYGLCGC